MKRWGLYIVVIVLGILFAVLGLFNSTEVNFDYVVAQKEIPLIFVMLISFVFGALLTLLVFGIKSLYWRSRALALEKQLVAEYDKLEEAELRREFENSRKV